MVSCQRGDQIFFMRGMNGTVILWRKQQCLEWLKNGKKLLEMLAVILNLLGGKPVRGAPLTTVRLRNSMDEQKGGDWGNGAPMLPSIYSQKRPNTPRKQ